MAGHFGIWHNGTELLTSTYTKYGESWFQRSQARKMKCSAKKFTFVLVLIGNPGLVFLLKIILWIFLNWYPLLHKEKLDCETSQSGWVMQLKWSRHLRLLSFYPPEQESGDRVRGAPRGAVVRIPEGCPCVGRHCSLQWLLMWSCSWEYSAKFRSTETLFYQQIEERGLDNSSRMAAQGMCSSLFSILENLRV